MIQEMMMLAHTSAALEAPCMLLQVELFLKIFAGVNFFKAKLPTDIKNTRLLIFFSLQHTDWNIKGEH